MRSLFRAFDARRVRYLVIGGQASVLYGAAFFTQDLDVWIEPVRANVRALARALEDLGARVHKLTPPLSLRHLRRGHGFHFRVPQPGGPDVYLDVMGQPPRAGRFGDASRRSERMRSPWGTLPVVAIEDLVEMKKTNRPADYEVITRLALIRVGRRQPAAAPVLRWALRNVYRVEDLWTLVSACGSRIRPSALSGAPAAGLLHRVWRRGRPPAASELSRAAKVLSRTVDRLQERGRAYWLPRIQELRRLRRDGRLMREGVRVTRDLA